MLLQNVSASCFVSKIINPKDEHGLTVSKPPRSHSATVPKDPMARYFYIIGFVARCILVVVLKPHDLLANSISLCLFYILTVGIPIPHTTSTVPLVRTPGL